MKRLLVALCFFELFSCKTEVKTVDACGDGLIDPGEQCDGVELAGVSCASLGYYNQLAEVSCQPDCQLDLTACGHRCGDDTVEGESGEQCDTENLNGASCVSLNFTNGGTLVCTDECKFDTSGCLTTCGNGNLEPGEICDDGNEIAGDGCAVDCTVEEGWVCEGESVSVCSPYCDRGLDFCSGECFDLANDAAHCGTCANACEGGEICVGSTCRDPSAPWVDAGSFAAFSFNVPATRYAITECASGPFVYAINTADPTHVFNMYQLGVVGEQWSPFPELEIEGTEDFMLEEGLSVTCSGNTKIAAYSAGGDQELAVRWYDSGDSAWKSFGETPLVTQCGGTNFLEMKVDSSGSVHVVSEGSGGCGMAVDYSWWDGSQWQAHPSMTGFPRQLTTSSAGEPSIVANGLAVFVGIAQRVDQPVFHIEHQVWYWMDESWHEIPLLDEEELNNSTEDMSLAMNNSGTLCAAYVKNMDASWPIPQQKIHVKCNDNIGGPWVRLGEAEINPDHNATAPHLAFVGTRLYLAYQRRVNGDTWHVNVVRWNPTTEVWDVVASEMESAPDYDSFRPRLVTHGGRVFVSFLQGDADMPQSLSNLFVKKP